MHSKKPLLKHLQNLVTPYYAASWKEIGLQLGIAQGILQSIEIKFQTDVEICCDEMFTEWLDTDVTASWGKLIQVVYSPAVTEIINTFSSKLPFYNRKESTESEAVEELESKLKDRHIVSRYKSSQDDWFSMPEHFTSVALIHQKKHKTKREIIAFANMHLKGNFTESGKITTDIAEIFKSVECNDNPYTLLIEGAPGIGKTILSKEIVFQWAKGNLLIKEKLVCLIYLRDPKVKMLNNFESFINYISYSRVSKDVKQYIYKKSGKGICLVFDGYDEYPEELRNNSFLSNLINHEVLELQLCNIVITSRPSASACLHNIVDLRVEILGFTKQHRKSYIMHALKDNPNAIQDLLEYLESSYSVDAYCHIPLSMAILVFLFKESDYDKNQLPTTQTEINYKFICITIRRFIKRSQQRSVSITKFSEVPATHRNILLEISKLAFTTLKDDKIVFSASEIKHFCPSLLKDQKHWNGLDLLKAVQYFSLEENTDELSFNFLHFSVQELLAAYHISLMSETQQIKLLKQTFWNVRYFNVWIMYVTLTKDRPFTFKHFLSGNRLRILTKFSMWWSGNANISIAKKMKEDKIKCLHLFQCFTEAGNDDMCQYVGNLLQDGRIDLSGQALSAIEMYTLSSFLARCVQRHWTLLDLSNCYLDDENFERFCKSYASLTKSTVYINTVNLSSNAFTKVSASQIANLALNFNVKQLVFASNELKDIGLDQATFVALLECPNLVESRCIKMQDDNQINIVLYKRSSNTLIMSELFMMCYCTVETYKDVYLFIENNSSFFEEFINTNSASIFKSMLHSLMNKMASISANLKLDVKSITITDKEVSNAISSLASNVPLAVRIGENHLPLLLSNISEKVIFSSLGTILFHGKFSIKTIHSMFLPFFDEIDLNQIYINGIALYDLLMNVALSKYTSLNSLQLQNCYVHDVTTSNNAVANMLSLVLSNTTLLEHLNLSGCRLKTEHMKIILETLTQVVSIVTISLSDNNLAYEVIDLLASVITCNRGLKCIELSNCNLQEEGILSITKALENCEELQSLDFSNNVITDDVAVSVAMLIEKCQSIQDLRLQNCQLQYVGIQKIAEAMVKKTRLHSIDLSGNAISNQNAMLIACIIANNKNVQKLAFSKCKLQSTGCQEVLQAMAKITSLVHLDLSNNLLTDIEVDSFDLMIHQNVSLEYLNISQSCADEKYFEKITHSLVTLKSLTHLDLSCNVTNITSANNIAVIIANNTFLEDLNLSKCEVFKSEFLNILSALQNIHHLKYLHCNNILVDYEEATGIAAVISNNPFLEKVNFNNYNLTEKEMKIILSSLKNHTSLKNFDISFNIITNDIVNDIVDVIDSNTQLTHLTISHCGIQEYGVLKIFKVVQRLKCIEMSNITISDQAAQTIANAMSVNHMIEEFVFTDNDFHETGIFLILDVLKEVHTLKSLTIVSNDSIGYINTKTLFTTKVTEVVSSNHITYFDVSNCHLEKSSCLSILNSLTLQAPTLQHIDLSGNNLSGTAETMAQLISVSYYLQHVNLANTLMQDEEVMIIIKAMQNINSLHYVDLMSYAINDEIAMELQDTIEKNPTVVSFQFTRLWLKKTEVAIMTCGISIFSIVINLQEISICFSDCKNQIDAVATLISSSPDLKHLHLENSSLLKLNLSSIFVALSRTTTLEYFCLINVVITDEVDDGIATVIEDNTHLKHFQLVACEIIKKQHTRYIQSFNLTKLSHLVLTKIINQTKMQLQGEICNSLTHLNLCDMCVDITKLSFLSLSSLTKLQHLDLSHNPLTDESANVLSLVICNNNGLKHLDLCDCKLKSEGIKDIFNALQKISITYLDMSLNTSSTSIVLLQTILPSLKYIEYLCLPYFELKQTEIDEIFDFISNDIVDLKFIDFGPNEICKSMVKDFKNIIFVSKGNKMLCFSAEGIKRVNFTDHEIENLYHSLHYLNINNITVDDKVGNTVAALIANSPELEYLEMSGGKWTVSSAVKCFKALQNNSHFGFLKFRSNHNNKYFALTEIFYLLSGCTALRVLDLHNCCKSELSSIVSITTESPTFLELNHLDLSYNYIDDEAVDYLTVLITNNVGLEYLNFCKCLLSKYNPNAKVVKIMQSIAESLKNLLHIDFSHLRCSREVVQHITTVITYNSKLKHINLRNCCLFTVDIENISQAAKKLTTLEYFNLSNNPLTSTLLNDTTTLITNNKNIKVLSLPMYTLVINDKHGIKVVLNTVTDILVKDMLTLITNNTVSELNLINCTLNNNQFKVVCNAVKKSLLPCILFTINEIENKSTDVENVVENISTIKGFKKVFKLLVIRDMSVHHGFDLVKLREIDHFSIVDCTFHVEEWNILKQLVIHNATTLDTLILSDCQLYGGISEIVCVCTQLSYFTLINVNIGASLMLSDNKPIDFKSQLCHLKTISISSMNFTKQMTVDVLSILYNSKNLDQFAMVKCNVPAYGDSGVSEAFFAFKNLIQLDLSSSQISNEIVDCILTDNNKLTHIKFASCKFDKKGVFQICNRLRDLYNIVYLNINNNDNICFCASKIAAIISQNKNLIHIEMAGCNFDTNGMIEIGNSLSSTIRLQYINLSHNTIAGHAVDAVVPVLNRLEHINLRKCGLTSDSSKCIIMVLTRNHSLKSVDLSLNEMAEDSVVDIAAMIANNDNIEVLCLPNCVTSAGSSNKGNFLSPFYSLSHYMLSSIFDPIKRARSLKCVEFGLCQLDSDLASEVAALTASNSSLKKLKFSKLVLTHNGFKQLGNSILIIEGLNSISITGVHFTDSDADNVATLINNNKSLQSFDISNCVMSEKGKNIIFEAMINLTSLKSLNLKNIVISDTIEDKVLFVIANNTSLEYLETGCEINTAKLCKVTSSLNDLKVISNYS